MFFWNKNKNNKIEKKEPELVLLKPAHNDYELSITKGVLEDNKIPYIVNNTSMGGYMKIRTGVMLESADILVNKSDFNKAKELIDSIFEPVDEEV